jgi:hypothetical protein
VLLFTSCPFSLLPSHHDIATPLLTLRFLNNLPQGILSKTIYNDDIIFWKKFSSQQLPPIDDPVVVVFHHRDNSGIDAAVVVVDSS